VNFPEPYAGLVLRYSYLWKREHEQGREEAVKDRPSAVVLVVTDEDGEKEVLVVPITLLIPTALLKFRWRPRDVSASTLNSPGS
jgi:hypothetical protein